MMHFHSIAIHMQLSVQIHYIQFTLKYILSNNIISVLFKSILKSTSFSQGLKNNGKSFLQWDMTIKSYSMRSLLENCVRVGL